MERFHVKTRVRSGQLKGEGVGNRKKLERRNIVGFGLFGLQFGRGK